MCGICGILHFDRHQPASSSMLERMMDRIRHRGPDGGGAFLSGPIGLGHRRLSIIDLATGDQPMSNENESVWVVYNGEIYNFLELRTELQALGHRFKSSSDTEVIVHMYEELGDACVSRFRGMFAFALWDGVRQRLLLARDRIGVKPLYYAKTPTSLLFASEIKALLVDSSIAQRGLSPAVIDRFLTYYYVPGCETLLQGINKLAPGHYLTVDDGKIAIEQYWDLSFDSPAAPVRFDDAVDELRMLLRRTIRDHMISDVPVGVLLSGGVDSTGVLRYVTEAAQHPLHTFTIGFSNGNFADERPYARVASQTYGTQHHEVSLTADTFRDFLPQYMWHMEELICEPPAVALFFLARAAQERGIKVLLSGEGGDEAFGGYPEYRNELLLDQLKTAFGRVSAIVPLGLKILGSAGWDRASRYAVIAGTDLSERYFSRTASPSTPFNRMKEHLYRKQFAATLENVESDVPTRGLLACTGNATTLNRMLYVDTKTWLPDDLLVKADRMTMATSVELRVPLLDHQILEFAASLPPTYKVRGFKLKRILKAALGDSVPKQILNRAKTGFPVPYAQWMRFDIKDFIFDTMMSEDAFWPRFFSRRAVSALLEAHQRGERNSKEVFCLLVFELWHREFLARALQTSKMVCQPTSQLARSDAPSRTS